MLIDYKMTMKKGKNADFGPGLLGLIRFTGFCGL